LRTGRARNGPMDDALGDRVEVQGVLVLMDVLHAHAPIEALGDGLGDEGLEFGSKPFGGAVGEETGVDVDDWAQGSVAVGLETLDQVEFEVLGRVEGTLTSSGSPLVGGGDGRADEEDGTNSEGDAGDDFARVGLGTDLGTRLGIGLGTWPGIRLGLDLLLG